MVLEGLGLGHEVIQRSYQYSITCICDLFSARYLCMVVGIFGVPLCNFFFFQISTSHFRNHVFIIRYALTDDHLRGHLTPDFMASLNLNIIGSPDIVVCCLRFISTLTAGPPQRSRLSMQLCQCKRRVPHSQFHMHPEHVLANCLP